MKILICSNDSNVREKIKLILNDKYELILSESMKMCPEIIENADISTFLTDEDVTFDTSVKIVPIEKPIRDEVILDACK